MSQLKSIWNMHEIDKEIKELELENETLEKNDNIQDILLSLQEKEYDITNFKTQLEVDDIKIQRLNQKLKQKNFKLKEVNEKLYSGEITNIKKLSTLQDEEKQIKEELEDIENEILKLLDNIESDTEKLYSVEKEYRTLKDKYKELKRSNKERSNIIKNKLKNLKEEIKKIKINLDKDVLEKYENLNKKKGKAIAKIDGDKCTGCHMSIPLSTISKIKKGNELIYCDNCGRILFYQLEDKA
ncbi:hypothetical protein GOQ29_06640 [Clostridium sp. D2Q-14]|uniref:zinc ribbon domain-containing protein n=1 Tax=Anaeromonas gelatinilytica TaxID=2683194 RepID=UPI00193C67AE|nr:C4-type zinc ribbon domain-containing protein [Anaeromonas gelatinilytica]MBS4535294.1 hypothetical protein [Anaeromonas gelatinilytica]